MNSSRDILPEDQKYWSFLKKNIRYRLREASFKRIHTSLVGDSKSLKDYEKIEKTLGSFIRFDKENNEGAYALSDLTLGICRGYIEYGLDQKVQPQELYSIDPIFSLESNKKIIHKYLFDYEVIGEKDPALDAQVVSRAYKILCDCGLGDKITVEINQLGDASSQEKIDQAMHDFYFDKLRTLPSECKVLFDNKKYLSLLSYPDEDCEILAKMAPKISDLISSESKDYFNTFKEYINEMGIPFIENEKFTDERYKYTGPIFRIIEGKNNTLISGGRYDNLISDLGGDESPACGAFGDMEKIVNSIKKESIDVPYKDNIQVYVAQLGPRAKKKSLSLLEDLRETGIHTMGSIGKSSISSQLDLANKFKADYCVLLGEQEVIDNKAIVKEMSKGSQQTIKYDKVIPYLIDKIGKENIIHFRDIEE